MTKKKFYIWFEEIKEKLGIRSTSFMKIFNYLDSQPDPITIVETGCLRIKDNFEGDGQSTLLFDKYIQTRDEKSKVYTVDINPEATKECKKIVSDNVEINTGDSVEYLGNFFPDPRVIIMGIPRALELYETFFWLMIFKTILNLKIDISKFTSI